MKATIHTQITPSLYNLLHILTDDLTVREKQKKRKRRRITKDIVCEELVKRCIEKKVILLRRE